MILSILLVKETVLWYIYIYIYIYIRWWHLVSTLVTSFVLYSLTRATLMSPGKDETVSVDICSEFIYGTLWRTLVRTEYFLFVHRATSILARLSTWCLEHSGNLSCSLLVNLIHTDESWEGRNTYLCIYKCAPGYHYNCFVATHAERELRVRGMWITNQFLDPANQKIVKPSFFTNCFFQNMITLKLSEQMISLCLSVYSIQGVKLNDERTKFRKLCGYTLKLRLSIFFSRSNIFS